MTIIAPVFHALAELTPAVELAAASRMAALASAEGHAAVLPPRGVRFTAEETRVIRIICCALEHRLDIGRIAWLAGTTREAIHRLAPRAGISLKPAGDPPV